MGKTTYKLTSYINKIEALYGKAREDFNKATTELAQLEESHRKKVGSGELNAKGLQRENERYTSKRKELLQTIADARDTFSKGAAEVRDSVDVLFRNTYRTNPESMDLKAVEMIKSGMLTERELLEMAAAYKESGNLAMYRFCGTRLDRNDTDPTIRAVAQDAHRALEREDLQTVDTFTDICLKGLRDDVALANGIDRSHEEFYGDIYRAAEDITATVDTPWGNE
jgi:hypothetical protein